MKQKEKTVAPEKEGKKDKGHPAEKKSQEQVKDKVKHSADKKASQLELLKGVIEKLKEDNLLQRAEFENSKKRIERQKLEDVKYAPLGIMRELITVIDNLKLALNYADKDDPLREGVGMALSEVEKIFKRFHLEPIKSIGEKFDPSRHEAISVRQDAGEEDGVIVEEGRVGYMLFERVVRASGVVVNRRPPAPTGSLEKEVTPDEPSRKE